LLLSLPRGLSGRSFCIPIELGYMRRGDHPRASEVRCSPRDLASRGRSACLVVGLCTHHGAATLVVQPAWSSTLAALRWYGPMAVRQRCPTCAPSNLRPTVSTVAAAGLRARVERPCDRRRQPLWPTREQLFADGAYRSPCTRWDSTRRQGFPSLLELQELGWLAVSSLDTVAPDLQARCGKRNHAVRPRLDWPVACR
jgi:hypothetical protein